MKQITSTNKTIAKNTIFLYFRMMVTMLISLYTSRVVLQVLGVNDYGLYAVVGGVVVMLSFVTSALSAGSSRFLTFELGTGNSENLSKTFSTLMSSHIILSIIVVLFAETIGLWFVYNKLAIPVDRMDSAVWVYHISVFTAIITMTQVPYNASIISREKMNVFAYVSIVEVSLKLCIVYMLQLGDFDKLVLYAVLICIVTISVALFYRFYCTSKFKETRYKFIIDKEILKSIGGFSGWSLFGNATYVLNTQGANIITNIFFNPTVVAALAISQQVNMAVLQFVQNFRTAVNPQIVKKYASKDYEGSKKLVLISTAFSFYLMLLLGLPVILLAQPILKFWLGQVPEYSIIFLQLIIIQSLFQVLDTSFLSAFQAKGRIKENALISPLFAVARFSVVYFLFQAGYSPVVLSYAGIISFMLVGIVVKPILLIKIVDYHWKDIIEVIMSCVGVILTALPIPILSKYLINSDKIGGFLTIAFITVISVSISIYYIGFDQKMRVKIVNLIQKKLRSDY